MKAPFFIIFTVNVSFDNIFQLILQLNVNAIFAKVTVDMILCTNICVHKKHIFKSIVASEARQKQK